MRILKILMVMCAIALFTTSFSSTKESRKHANVWFKVSSDETNPGIIVALDMSVGYAAADRDFIYIVVLDKDSVEYTIVFPNGGLWTAPAPDEAFLDMEEEIENLEEYLKKRESIPIEKSY